MSLERSGQDQPSENERVSLLWRLHKDLNPFQETPESKRLRVIGLSNLYLRMADPSMEFLQTLCGSLVCIPLNDLQYLQFDTFGMREDPKQFSAEQGIAVGEQGRLMAGADNTLELLTDIIRKHADTEPAQDAELDPNAFAESTYEKIQISQSKIQIRQAAERVICEPSLSKRYRMGLNLKKRIMDCTGRFNLILHAKYNQKEQLEQPTWENLIRYGYFSAAVRTKDGGISRMDEIEHEAITAQAAIRRYLFEKRLTKLPTRDRERFDQLRLQYGAKAANLIILSEVAGNINNLRMGYNMRLVVPDFKAVPVDLYRAWRAGNLPDDIFRPYFEWVSGLKVMDEQYEHEVNSDYIVRSSAVFFEDGEKHTGAGVYESTKVKAGSSFQDFKDAVIKVYKSTESPQAQSYRAQRGIDSEEMGLVIQKYVYSDHDDPGGQSQEGYINSRLTGIPSLMEVITGTSRNFIRRKELDFLLALKASEGAFRKIYHFLLDANKVNYELLIGMAKLTAGVERIWGKDIQIEFVRDTLKFNLVQVRELPASMSTATPEVQFPDKSPIYSGTSIGICDTELSVLDNEADNRMKTGAVVFSSNRMWTTDEGNFLHIPKRGAVIICHDEGRFGHLQTICAEKGLVCVFPDVDEVERPAHVYSILSGEHRVRIVSNGFYARVYRAL